MKVAVITAIYDDYDQLKVFEQQLEEVEWICVTDTAKYLDDSRGWKIVYEPRPGVHPNLAARRAKMQPWYYTNAEASIWIDASFQVISKTFVNNVIPFANPIAQFKHPWVECCLDEAEVCMSLSKYDGSVIARQKEYYINDGMPRKWGLWAGGCIVRIHTPEIIEFGAKWLEQEERWFPPMAASNDQISEPYVLYKLGLRPRILPGQYWDNGWIIYRESERHHKG